MDSTVVSKQIVPSPIVKRYSETQFYNPTPSTPQFIDEADETMKDSVVVGATQEQQESQVSTDHGVFFIHI